MHLEEAEELTRLATSKNLHLSSAPCSVLSETAQTIWKALRERHVGDVRLVYAELDDGMIFNMHYGRWITKSGAPWPAKDEFETGCTLEHAAYYTTWLTAFFGPAKSVTAFSSCLYPDKGIKLDKIAPDFSVACILFSTGIVARLTNSIVAPHDQTLRFFGDTGIVSISNAWDYQAPVYIHRTKIIRNRSFSWKRKYPLVKRTGALKRPRNSHRMEFCRGLAEMVVAIQENRESALPADFCLHNIEIALAIQSALENSSTYHLKTTFKPLEPMNWAR
jgi:predicted dehydrogenase